MKILAVVESLTGNTASFIDYVNENYIGLTIDIKDPCSFISDDEWGNYDKIMIGCYTIDMGKIPIETKEFIIEYRDILLTQNVLLFGSGWTVYESYCKAVDSMNIILKEKFPKIKFELRFDPDLEIEAINTLRNFIYGGEN